MEGLFKWPMFDVVCLGSCPRSIDCGLMSLKASITTFPLTDWIGSMTTATTLLFKASKLCWVFISTPESQQPNPGWEWYQPTTISGLWREKEMSFIGKEKKKRRKEKKERKERKERKEEKRRKM